MTWKVFSGELSDLFAAMCIIRASKDGFGETPDGVARCLRSHLHRGLGYLASGNETKSIADFGTRWLIK